MCTYSTPDQVEPVVPEWVQHVNMMGEKHDAMSRLSDEVISYDSWVHGTVAFLPGKTKECAEEVGEQKCRRLHNGNHRTDESPEAREWHLARPDANTQTRENSPCKTEDNKTQYE